jgi:hypothetical protein
MEVGINALLRERSADHPASASLELVHSVPLPGLWRVCVPGTSLMCVALSSRVALSVMQWRDGVRSF